MLGVLNVPQNGGGGGGPDTFKKQMIRVHFSLILDSPIVSPAT